MIEGNGYASSTFTSFHTALLIDKIDLIFVRSWLSGHGLQVFSQFYTLEYYWVVVGELKQILRKKICLE
jgi:hypothetical protein